MSLSGIYGHTLGIGLGYIEEPEGVNTAMINYGKFEMEVTGILETSLIIL